MKDLKSTETNLYQSAVRTVDDFEQRGIVPKMSEGWKEDDSEPQRANLEPTGVPALDAIAKNIGIPFEIGGDAAAYQEDREGNKNFVFPRSEQFASPAIRRGILAHELTHATREAMGRPPSGLMGLEHMLMMATGIAPRSYNEEEMVAETGSVLLRDALGDLSDEEKDYSGVYLAGYLKGIPKDERAAVLEEVAGKAEAAADYLLSLQ